MISDRSLLRLLRSPSRVALYGDLARWTIGMLVVCLIVAVIDYYVLRVTFIFRAVAMNDFGKFYYAAQHFLAGVDMYAPSPATDIPVSATARQQFLNMNPPHLHLALLPLAALPLAWAAGIWGVLNLSALMWSLRLIAQELQRRWTFAGVLWCALAVTVNATTEMVVVTGQLTYLLMLLVTLSWLSARRGQPTHSGSYLGLAVCIKPFLGLFFLHWVLNRRWKELASALLTGAAVSALGIVVFGTDNYVSWFRALQSVEWTWATMNASLSGPISRALTINPFFDPVVNAPNVVPIVTALGALTVGAATLWSLAVDRGANAVDREFVAVTAAALLISPLGWAYYFPLFAGPAFAIVLAMRTRPSALRTALVPLVVLCLHVPILLTTYSRHPAYALTIGSAYAWCLLAIWLATLADLQAARVPVRAGPPPHQAVHQPTLEGPS